MILFSEQIATNKEINQQVALLTIYFFVSLLSVLT